MAFRQSEPDILLTRVGKARLTALHIDGAPADRAIYVQILTDCKLAIVVYVARTAGVRGAVREALAALAKQHPDCSCCDGIAARYGADS